METRRVLTAVLAVLGAAAGAEAQPKAAFPAGEAEFGAMLNWVAAADADAQDRFVEAAGAATEGATDSVATTQVALLRQAAKEGRASSGDLLKGYGEIASKQRDAPAYRATAAVRCAQLHEALGNPAGAAVPLAYARRTHPDGTVWVLRGAVWESEPVADLADREFHRLYDARIEYRAARGLADLVPLTGAARFLGCLAIVFVAYRLLSFPWFLRAMPEIDRYVAEDQQPLRPQQLYILLWLVLDFVLLRVIGQNTGSWQFVFDLDRTSFLWLPALTDTDVWTRLLRLGLFATYMTAMFWPFVRRKPWVVGTVLAGLVVVDWFYRPSQMAWGDLFDAGLFLSGAVLVIGYRVWQAARPPGRGTDVAEGVGSSRTESRPK